MALTRKDVMNMGGEHRKMLLLNEAIFDAVLDADSRNLLDRLPEETDDDFALRLAEEKVRLHEEFSENILQDVADGHIVILPFDFSEYQDDFAKMQKQLLAVNSFPQSRYDDDTYGFVRELCRDVPLDAPLADTPVLFYSNAAHGMGCYEFSLNDMPGQTEGLTAADGHFVGVYGESHQRAYNTMVNTDALLLLSQYLKMNGELPLRLSEAQAIRQMNEGRGIQVTAGMQAEDMLHELESCFEQIRPVQEGKTSVFSKGVDLKDWMESSGFTQDALLAKYGAMGMADGKNREYGSRMEYLDIFGVNETGQQMANTQAVQAFLNNDQSAQRGFTQDDSFESFAIQPDDMLYIRTSEYHDLDKAHVYRHIGPGAVQDLGKAVTEADRLGISQLKPYMNDDVYAEYTSLLSTGVFSHVQPSLQGIRNSIAVFEELDRRGLDYKVEMDVNRGQLRASVESPRIDFRIMDLEHPDKIGRGWLNGSSIYFKTDKKHPKLDENGQRVKKNGKDQFERDVIMPDEQMVRDLVSYSLGERVLSPDQDSMLISQDGTERNDEHTYVGQGGLLHLKMDENTAVPVMSSLRMLDGSGTKSVPYNGTYMSKGRKFTAFYSTNKNKWNLSGSWPVSIYSDASARNVMAPQDFGSAEEAREWLLSKMDMASANFKEAVLSPILETEEVKDILGNTVTMGNGHPLFDVTGVKPEEELKSLHLSADPNVRALQENYITYLTTEGTILRSPHMDDVEELLKSDTLQGLSLFQDDLENAGTAVNKHLEVASNLDGLQDTMFGHMDGQAMSLNVAHILEYSDATADDMILALQTVQQEHDVEFLNETGEFTMNRIKEKMVAYDEASSRSILNRGKDNEPGFMNHVSSVVQESLQAHGMSVKDIRIDENGIIQYTGSVANGMRSINGNGIANVQDVTGYIGQVFEPDENGVIITNFNHDDNYAIVPGYKASVSRGEGSMESRTILKGYEQMLDEQLRISIHSSFLRGDFNGMNNTRLNAVYRHMYDERLPKDYETYFQDIGMGNDLMHATIETMKRSVRYPTSFREDSSLNTRLDAMKSNLVNDCNHSGFSVTKRDVAILADSERGYFDMVATSTGITQGLTRYLAEGASVDEQGHIIPSPDKFDKCPLLKLDVCKNIDYNPFDRQQMVFSNLSSCFNVARSVGTAHMSLEGWTFDDGYVISKDFAEQYQVPIDASHPEKGRRPMKKGDKISDFNGNKGVINLVVDREMHSEAIESRLSFEEDSRVENPDGSVSFRVRLDDVSYDVKMPAVLEEGQTQSRMAALDVQRQLGYEGCDRVIKLFEKNLDLDVVGAPFTAPSRMNGGTVRDMMEDAVSITMPDGMEVAGGMGYAPYIITDMTVDEKTHLYDDEEVAKGKGRSASSQLAWGLQASGATAIMKEFYGDNIDNMRTIRERMIALGLDFDEDYNIVNGYHPQMDGENIEERPIIEMPVLPDHPEDVKPRKHPEDIKAAMSSISMELSQHGGFMRMPFPIQLATGEETPAAPDGNGYLLPVMPPRYRADQTYDDNTAIIHDYTRRYMEIAESCLQYQQNERMGLPNDEGKDSPIASAKKSYADMSTDIQTKYFEGKYNQWKRLAMGKRLPNSATAVWTGDPRLKLDEIAMNHEMAKTLGVKEGRYIMTWRDPMLRKEGIAALKVKIDDTLSGVAINPAMDLRYDGDFDGDSIALVNLQTAEAYAELIEKFSVKNTLFDYGKTGPAPKNINDISMAVNTGLDIASALGSMPAETRASYDGMLKDAKQAIFDKDYDKALDTMDAYVHGCFANAFGSDHIVYDTMESHLKSVDVMVSDHKAKGKTPKLQEYCDYLGVDAVFLRDAEGNITHLDAENCKDNVIPGILSTDAERYAKALDMFSQTEQATSIKSQGTGFAGAFSQRGVKGCRNDCIDSVIETTYGTTQGIVQAKHDAKEAEQKYNILRDVLPALWRGQAICEQDGVWKASYDADGKPVWNDRRGFIEQYSALCNSKNGLNFTLSKDHIERLSQSLYVFDDEKGFERIRNVYKKDVAGVSALDRLAYGGDFNTLKEMAGNTNLFDSEQTRLFCPEGTLAQSMGRQKVNNFARQHAAVYERQETGEKTMVMQTVIDMDRPVTVKTVIGERPAKSMLKTVLQADKELQQAAKEQQMADDSIGPFGNH